MKTKKNEITSQTPVFDLMKNNLRTQSSSWFQYFKAKQEEMLLALGSVQETF